MASLGPGLPPVTLAVPISIQVHAALAVSPEHPRPSAADVQHRARIVEGVLADTGTRQLVTAVLELKQMHHAPAGLFGEGSRLLNGIAVLCEHVTFIGNGLQARVAYRIAAVAQSRGVCVD